MTIIVRASTALALILGAQAAFAQTQPPAAPAQDDADAPRHAEGNIVVTGIRRANAAAIESKRRATNIVDVVSATDVRALPDTTIVEALRRVPGLSVLPATDNEHPRDEAATPVLRGLGPSYNNVTIDGLTIASPGTPNGTLGSITRGVRLDILPASMVSEIQVVKTFSADLDPNATGGAINLKTRSAFAQGGKPFFTMEASLGHAGDTGKPRDQRDPGYRLIATGSTTFGAAHQFGATLSANYQTLSSYTETHMTTDTVHYGFYDAKGVLQSGSNLGNGYAVPQQDKYWYVMNRRDRFGITGKLEARVSDGFDVFATGGYYVFRDNMERNEIIIDPRNRNRVFNQTATSGSYPGGDVEVGYANQITTARTRVGQAGFNWRPGAGQLLSGRASISNATYVEPIFMVKYATNITRPAAVATTTTGSGATINATGDYAFTYDTSALDQRFPISAAAYNAVGNYSLLYWRPASDYVRRAGNRIATGRLDYGLNQGFDDRGAGFAIGLSYTDDRPRFDIRRTEYQPNATAPGLKIADVLGPSNAIMPYLGLNLFAIDPAKARAQVEAAPRSAYNATDQLSFSNQDDFTHREKLFGAYALMSWRGERLNVQAGLHYDDTTQSTVGRQRQYDKARAAYVYVDRPTGSAYHYLLPSTVLTFHATPTIDLRAGASRMLGRPPYDAYAARTSISFVNPNDQGNPDAVGVTVTIGNPDIRPRLSNNLDLAADLRIAPFDGQLSLAAFNKRIENEIFTLTNVTPFTFDGTTYANAAVSTPANAAGARVRGLEGSLILNTLRPVAPVLAGFGIAGNVALLRGRLTVPYSPSATTVASRTLDRLVGQPDYTANVTVFYNTGGLELRAAYNRQGRALRTVISNISWQDLYWAPRSQVDLSATYRVNPAVSLIGQVGNVTHHRITSLTGPGVNLLKDSYSVPTTFWLGLRVTPKF
ncbi:TonB-dependent receptor [Sphingomonas sp. MA1305]|uniref:TonB-dependent receptor n=1 Tax=Sphingomonas sp. MA1305 TaxID=2479204 RepID=UPI0018DFD35E|nr:TonB-dependent receptor [Sphingomonas sp. MA1305]MBI0477203.1 TonB-dependent receptor [Sphingomonas sp. MA1305]